MIIREAVKNDIDTLAKLAVKLWEDNTPEMLEEEFTELIKNNDCVFFLLYEDNEGAGFAQCQLRRDYVEGTNTSPVGYLEGIFVKKEYRGRGYAKSLLRKCEEWARQKGCFEFASDCETCNDESLKFHLNTGFTEANRIICFTKKLK